MAFAAPLKSQGLESVSKTNSLISSPESSHQVIANDFIPELARALGEDSELVGDPQTTVRVPPSWRAVGVG